MQGLKVAEIVFSNNQIYINQTEATTNVKIDWQRFKNKSFFITGASGLIGTFLIDTLMCASEKYGLNIKIYAVSRNEENAKNRFSDYWNNNHFTFIKHDVNETFITPNFQLSTLNYIIHGASNTHPLQYSQDPIGTIAANVTGTQNILEFAAKQNHSRVMFLSSVEIYGENRGDVDKFDEIYCGYIDCNTLRAGYPESKRLGEALCQAYIKAKNLDIVIPRLSRVYGPTMSESDSKAIAQFIKKAVNKENIILKSKGEQFFSYTYVSDAVTALLYILLHGENGEAYNVSGDNSDIALKDLTETLADITGTKVIFELPDEIEASGYSKATKAVLDNSKLKVLGWESKFDIRTGLGRTVDILNSSNEREMV